MNRCTVIDLLEDKYGIKKLNLTKRELAIIGLCTGELADDEEPELNLHPVSKCCKCGENEGKGKTNQCDSCLMDGIM